MELGQIYKYTVVTENSSRRNQILLCTIYIPKEFSICKMKQRIYLGKEHDFIYPLLFISVSISPMSPYLSKTDYIIHTCSPFYIQI